MSTTWLIVIIVLVIGFIAGNVLLLRSSKKFNVPKDFTPRKWDDEDDK